MSRYSEYVLTKDSYEEATTTSPMFALDCEMCKTTTGDLELTRISIVDESMNVSRRLYIFMCYKEAYIYFNLCCRLFTTV